MTTLRDVLATGLVAALVLTPLWASRAPDEDEPTALEVAASVHLQGAARAEALLVRADDVRSGETGTLLLTGEDLTALVRYGLPGVVPSGLVDLEMSIDAGTLQITGALVHADFDAADELGALASALPDPAIVSVSGRLQSWSEEWISFGIESATVERIPVPRAVLAAVVSRLPFGRAPEARNAANEPSLRVRRPHGVGHVYLAGRRLVVESAEPFRAIAVDEDSP